MSHGPFRSSGTSRFSSRPDVLARRGEHLGPALRRPGAPHRLPPGTRGRTVPAADAHRGARYAQLGGPHGRPGRRAAARLTQAPSRYAGAKAPWQVATVPSHPATPDGSRSAARCVARILISPAVTDVPRNDMPRKLL